MISVDKIYKSVLSILNKEQRGVITPDEFAKAGSISQLDIMNSLFKKLSLYINEERSFRGIEGSADLVNQLEQSIEHVSTYKSIQFLDGIAEVPSDVYLITGIQSEDRSLMYEELSKSEMNSMLSSRLTRPSLDFPSFFISKSGNSIELFPKEEPIKDTKAIIDYVINPTPPRWGYSRSQNTGAYVYDDREYNESGLVIRENALTNVVSNFTNAAQGVYVTTGLTSGGVEVDLSVTVDLGSATSIEVLSTGSDISSSDTIDVSLEAITGAIGSLVLQVSDSDLYSNSTLGSVDFILHPKEEPELIKSIMAYLGITIQDPEVTQGASQLLNNN